MPKKSLFIIALLAMMLVLPESGLVLSAHAKPPVNLAVVRQQFRNEYINFEKIINALDIRPGMSILDIGAGPGYASFVFAEKLQGSGEVYATDIRPGFVRYIAEEAKRRRLNNLFSVQVKERGLDEFYTRHRYDLVFLSNVYHCLDNRVDYFRAMRRFLKPDARLVLILYDEVPLFSLDDLSDADGLIASLSGESDDNPFVRHLSNTTRQLLKDKTGGETLEAGLVDDFNRMLTDPGFYKNFYSNFYFRKDFLTPSERDFANWLLMSLDEEGILEKPVDQIDAKEIRSVIKLNRLFFMKRFGNYLQNEGRGAYIPAGDANRHMSKYVMLRELGAAGYAFSRETALSPFFNAIIMVPKQR